LPNATLHFRFFSGVPGLGQPLRDGGNPALLLREPPAKYKAIPGVKLGEKIPPNYF
jgi:hypothetical protein